MTEKDAEDTKGIFKVISRKQACNSRQRKKERMKKDKKTKRQTSIYKHYIEY